METETLAYHASFLPEEAAICKKLAELINRYLDGSENKIWHRHPVWFLEGNPVVGYSRQKAGIRLMFWSGADFGEEKLKPGTGKFKDASVFYQRESDVSEDELKRWLEKAGRIQWDYKNIVKRKGRLEKLGTWL